ncbi:hypothetical protein [Pseudomonas sp. UBA6323]|uniref:hypothetical protein n=1 Tax=Pseudomonas sp. UBA6323 TaxID=1947329 RepID=UPI0025E15311|nr:hypothetical protein [Pseudomonas sp. UBA6323]
MSNKPAREQLMGQIAEAAVTYQQAETQRNSLRRELNRLYSTYFAAHGHPYPDDTRKRVDPDDDAFLGVVHFTEPAYRRWSEARDLTARSKRKMRVLIQRLERAQ